MSRRVVIVGGGAAGLSAAYTLKKLGFTSTLLEAEDRVGGRLVGDSINGFLVDTGADFFCSSYDAAFRICEELGLSLVRSKMKLGWFRNGRWTITTPGLSPHNLLRNLPAARALGFLSPHAVLPNLKLFGSMFRQAQFLNFASDSRIAELDGEETFGHYLERLGVPEHLQVTFKGFLEMTMGHVESAGEAYMRHTSERCCSTPTSSTCRRREPPLYLRLWPMPAETPFASRRPPGGSTSRMAS